MDKLYLRGKIDISYGLYARLLASDIPADIYRERHSTSAVEQAARDLFALTWIGDWDTAEFKRPGRWQSLGKIRAAMDAGQWATALLGIGYIIGNFIDIHQNECHFNSSKI